MPRVKHTTPVRSPRLKRRRDNESFFDEAIPSDTPEQEHSTNVHVQRSARPIRHVSVVNVPRCNLLFSMIQNDYTINVARIILDELQGVVDGERIRGVERVSGSDHSAMSKEWCIC